MTCFLCWEQGPCVCEVIHKLITKEPHYCPFLSQGRPPGVPPLKLASYQSCENLSGHVIYPDFLSAFNPFSCFKALKRYEESAELSQNQTRQRERSYFTSTLLSPVSRQQKDVPNAQVHSQSRTGLPTSSTSYPAQLSITHYLYSHSLSPPPIIIEPVVSQPNDHDKVGQYIHLPIHNKEFHI